MKKILSSILIVLIMLFALTTSVSALSFTPTMYASSQTIPEQTEFIVTVKLSNLDVGQNGINSLTGNLTYDTTVLETISESSIEGLNSWKVEYSEDTKEIKAIKASFVNQEEQVFQITFKTKSGVTGKNANISFTSVNASNSESKIPAADISTTIKVGTETEPTSTPISINGILTTNKTTNNTTNTNAVRNLTINSIIQNNVNTTNTTNNTANTTNISRNNTVNNTTNNTAKLNSIYNTNTSNQDLSYAGVEDGIVKLIFGILIIAALSYWRIHSLKEIK